MAEFKKEHLQTHNFGQWYVSGHPRSNLKPRGWFKLRIAVNLRETSGSLGFLMQGGGWQFPCSTPLRLQGGDLGSKTAKTYIRSLKGAIINIGCLWATQCVFGDSIGIQLLSCLK